MSKIILVTHGDFAKGILSSMNVIVGETSNIYPVCMYQDTSRESLLSSVVEVIEKHGSNHTYILITDIPGGSTTSTCVQLLEKYSIKMISGLNLGLLLELYLSDLSDDDVISSVVKKSKDLVMFINEKLSV